jgi:hypothetical protein
LHANALQRYLCARGSGLDERAASGNTVRLASASVSKDLLNGQGGPCSAKLACSRHSVAQFGPLGCGHHTPPVATGDIIAMRDRAKIINASPDQSGVKTAAGRKIVGRADDATHALPLPTMPPESPSTRPAGPAPHAVDIGLAII